jgi:hypothetical protein
MDQSIFHQAQATAGRREALRWLAETLNWERRLGELRPAAPSNPTGQVKQAA